MGEVGVWEYFFNWLCATVDRDRLDDPWRNLKKVEWVAVCWTWSWVWARGVVTDSAVRNCRISRWIDGKNGFVWRWLEVGGYIREEICCLFLPIITVTMLLIRRCWKPDSPRPLGSKAVILHRLPCCVYVGRRRQLWKAFGFYAWTKSPKFRLQQAAGVVGCLEASTTRSHGIAVHVTEISLGTSEIGYRLLALAPSRAWCPLRFNLPWGRNHRSLNQQVGK